MRVTVGYPGKLLRQFQKLGKTFQTILRVPPADTPAEILEENHKSRKKNTEKNIGTNYLYVETNK